MAGLLDSTRWEVLPQDRESERLLSERLGIAPLVARVLVARGITEVGAARAFINPSLERDWTDPLDIPGMAQAADRVETALDRGERIAVFGDFDVDGMTSTCLLTQALHAMGAVCDPYIPHRFGEGYGLSRQALDRVIAGSDPDLIITVDNGIAAAEEVAWLLDRGVDVVITDHHEPGDLVPRGVPVTDPKLSADCPSRELAGAGVALKLVCELGRRRGMPDLWRGFVDLASLGTVSDMMLLQGENRSLVAEGIRQIRASARPGLIALAATAGVDLADVTSDNLPFSLIPRLNAAGRMGCTEVAFDLLFTADHAEAARLAGALERTNTERRDTEAKLSEEALAQIEGTYGGERVIVLAGEGWHEGVKGIVASRVVSRYHVPAIVFSVADGIARGSGRSVGSVDLFHAVEQCAEEVVRFGGHAGAVGVTCEAGRVDAFRRRLQEVMAALPPGQFVDRGEVAALADLSELGRQTIASIEVLQPFGQGNKRPLLGIRNVYMRNRSRVGAGIHLRFDATDGENSIASIMFRVPQIERAYACSGMVDLVVDAVNETWQGRTKPKLMVRDILYHDQAAPAAGGLLDAELELEEAQENVLAAFGGATLIGGSLPQAGMGAAMAEDAARRRPERLVPPGSETSQGAGSAPGGADGVGAATAPHGATQRAALERLSAAGLTERLRQELIGSSRLLAAQGAALERLEQGRSTLCVMATGRGKSLIFHLHAARVAIAGHKASVFVFPLRALVSDQAFHLSETFARLGIGVRVLTGETSADDREAVYAALADGTADVVLTTPEYLAIHVGDFARTGRIGFLVVDEAHHAGAARGGNRGAYTELPRVLATLGDPVALAVTATASQPVAREICRLLSIDEGDVLQDRSVRENLAIVDHRDLRDRDTLLSTVVAAGEKTIVYVNSRGQASQIARNLRSSVPELGQAIAFYHAGLPRELRLRVEKAFRGGRLSCIVSTSAFGEGVNLPGVRNVVLYHMPFGATEFNQMSGRAGRDGAPASVHLLYGSRDSRINEGLLQSGAPSRDDLAVLYRALMTEMRRSGSGRCELGDDELREVACAIDRRVSLDVGGVSTGLAVFEELGLLNIQGFEDSRRIRMVSSPAKVDLESSLRYREGSRALEEFAAFREWALTSRAQEMLARINRPITPGFGLVVDR